MPAKSADSFLRGQPLAIGSSAFHLGEAGVSFLALGACGVMSIEWWVLLLANPSPRLPPTPSEAYRVVLWCCEAGSHVAQAGLKLAA